MGKISNQSTIEEIAVLVSEALERAGVDAVLGGGGAVGQYSKNEYESADLDFITTERNRVIAPIVAKLGFEPRGKDFHHPHSAVFIEFPPGPLAFGDRYVENSSATTLETQYGKLRIITPTQCVMDRLVWFIHGNDGQSWDQAVLVAKHQTIDWPELEEWAASDGIDRVHLDSLRELAEAP